MRLTAKIIPVLVLLVLISSFTLPQKNAVKATSFNLISTKILNDSTDTDSSFVTYIPFKENAHASYYHEKFNGRKTASGELFDNNLYTAAHKTLKFGTRIRVTNTVNDSSVIVTVNDRGPFVKDRELDLSRKAFMEIAKFKQRGYLIVNIEILEDPIWPVLRF
ncbi:septal ring lytic transglycosylase RlpA family protein [Mariniflexile sp.]|uniref:septal ring lytic transglycosylase RlpA family protein n=1 Tax=Mariniflexile sp. TaxID=1979402 RepID=UPI00404781ED